MEEKERETVTPTSPSAEWAYGEPFVSMVWQHCTWAGENYDGGM